MKLKPNDFFATPADSEALFSWLNQLPTRDSVRLTAITAAMMAWNLASKLTSQDSDLNAGEARS